MSLGKFISFCACLYFVWTPVVQKDDFDPGISDPRKLGCGDCFAPGVSAPCSAATSEAFEVCRILIPSRSLSRFLEVSRGLTGKHSVVRATPYSICIPPTPTKSDSQGVLGTPGQFSRPLEWDQVGLGWNKRHQSYLFSQHLNSFISIGFEGTGSTREERNKQPLKPRKWDALCGCLKN